MSSSKKTVSNQNTTGTTNVVQTPTNPAFVTQGLGQIGTQATNLASQDPYSFVAGPDPLQTQAATGAAGLTLPQGFTDAAATANGVANAAPASISSHLAEFQDPFENQVVDTTLAGYDQTAGRQRAQDQLGLAGDTTFGGSGGSILQALDNQNLNLGRSQTEAQLRNQGFNTALTGATAQGGLDAQAQAQRLAAAQTLSSNATAQNNAGNQNVNTQSAIGQLLQQLAQAKAGAPINTLGSISSILSGLPLGLLHGDTSDGTQASTSNGTSTTSGSDPLGSIGALLKGLGSIGGGGFQSFNPAGAG